MERELTSRIDGVLTNRDIMRSFPKVELHRHLEGSFFLPTLHRIARKNGLDVPSGFSDFRNSVQFPPESEPDFLTFLSLFRNDWYRNLDDVAEITHDSIAACRDDGLVYLEARFSPEHFALDNDFDRIETTRVVIDAANAAAQEIGLELRYLITFNRSKQTAAEMIELYERIYALDDPAIVGIDLAGDEINFPPELFRDFFDRVRADGRYESTIHAGEVSPSQQIWSAIRDLGAKRIGHGVSAINDEELQQYLTEHEITLEQCITSNYQTGSWADDARHPLADLHRRGVPVTVNSDDPSIQGALLSDDYVKTVRNFGFGIDDLVALNERAITASFADEGTKERIRARFHTRVGTFCSLHNV